MGYFRFKVGDKIRILPQYADKYNDWREHKNDIGIITHSYWKEHNPGSQFDYHVRWLITGNFNTSLVTHTKITGANWAELPQIHEHINKYKG